MNASPRIRRLGEALPAGREHRAAVALWRGEEGLLDRLGGGAWQAKKAKLKERIREIADALIRIAAERALRKGPRFEPPPGAWDEFCARFPYEETDDQLQRHRGRAEDLARARRWTG
jgi:transcription-repair coupling factor (superfamily II helicase)